jgi:hypothetical protein
MTAAEALDLAEKSNNSRDWIVALHLAQVEDETAFRARVKREDVLFEAAHPRPQ